MKRWIGLSVAILVVAVAGMTLVALPRSQEWTTSSPEALAAYEAGDAALNKVYVDEARAHFQRALEYDPDFFIAKLRVAQFLEMESPENAEQMFIDLSAADLTALTPRERFVIEYSLAIQNRKTDEAAQLLDQCVSEHPNDPYMIEIKAGELWRQGHLEEAEELFQRLLEIDPNWAVAYNALGYIKMMQGRFPEAEDRFKRYRYIAPDQANPHDSLGELFTNTGRYQEAEMAFERAIETKPDFWASYLHLAILKSYASDWVAVDRIIDRGRAEGMPQSMIVGMVCRAHYAELADREAWEQILEERDSQCVENFTEGLAAIVTHRAACRTGDWDTALALEQEAAEILAGAEKNGDVDLSMAMQPVVPHLEGVRLAIEGNLVDAGKLLRETDDRLTFMEVSFGTYKLYNRLLLAEILLAEGKDGEAHTLLDGVRRINPLMVQEFEDSGFRILGLGSRLTLDTTRSTENPKPRRSRMSL